LLGKAPAPQATKGRAVGGVKRVGVAREQVASATSRVEEPGTLRGQAREILALLRGAGPSPIARLEERHPNARAAVKRLVALGLAQIEEREREAPALFSDTVERDTPPEPTAGQAEAVAAIEASLGGGNTKAFLLFGVTGSGKTEVYLRAIAACLERGRGAVVLVPEIALTPQLVQRFRARFGDEVAIVHSALSDRDRHRMLERLRRGEVRVAIGARSALLAPVPSLGLVIVDEEHDGSFKQEEGVRYSARDMALLRAHRAGATVILGSATPSLESWELVRRGRLELLRLPARARAEATLPKVEIVDLRRIGPGPTGHRLLSLPLHRALEQTLARGEQAIVFLNRRGHSPTILCGSCGTVTSCPACSVSLTFHARGRIDDAATSPPLGRVRCHYCGYDDELPSRCGGCGASALLLEGLGTEKLEETIATAFPSARVARLDRDVAEGAKSAPVLERMRRGEIDVLVGTQMVAKGHDYPRVTLVGVVNADAALSLPDFRASERTFQLLVQVAGRAGRHDQPGRVIVQTRSPDHPAIEFARRHDVEGFLGRELVDREEVHYPPFARLALVRLDAIDLDVVTRAAQALADHARALVPVRGGKVELLGPTPAPLARLRGRHRMRVLLRATDRGPLRVVLTALAERIGTLDRRVRASIDVDPVGMM
jgi:primosomal protein N' (replication factor Y)